MVEGFHFGGLWISSLLFADDVNLMASSSGGLPHTVEGFTAEWQD